MQNNASNLHQNHRRRMRDRLKKTNGKGFAHHELLEMLLYYSVPRRDTNEMAHRLIDKFGSLGVLFDANQDEIAKIEGISENTASLIKLVKAIHDCDGFDKNNLRVFNDYAETGEYLVSEFAGSETEKIFLILLDGKNRVLHCDFFDEGSFKFTRFDMRRLTELVLCKKASQVIIAHNHIDGDPNPSPTDRITTADIESFLARLDVSFAEHYIIADNVYIGLKHLSQS